MRGTASSVARPSSSERTRNASRSSSRSSVLTRTPLFASNVTRPRAARRRSASRMGVRETWYCSESCSWRSTEPGAICPETISSSRSSAMSSALVPTVLMCGRLPGRRRHRERAVVDPHRHERQVALVQPVLDRVRELGLVAVLHLHGKALADELGGQAVLGERLHEARAVALSGQLNGRHRLLLV